MIDGTGGTGSRDSFAKALPRGDYTLQVKSLSSSSKGVFDYRVVVTLR